MRKIKKDYVIDKFEKCNLNFSKCVVRDRAPLRHYTVYNIESKITECWLAKTGDIDPLQRGKEQAVKFHTSLFLT